MRMWRVCIECQNLFGCVTVKAPESETRTCWKKAPAYFATHECDTDCPSRAGIETGGICQTCMNIRRRKNGNKKLS